MPWVASSFSTVLLHLGLNELLPTGLKRLATFRKTFIFHAVARTCIINMDARLWSGGVSVLQAANVAAFAIAIALNASLGSSNKAISDAHRTAFTPAGYAFSIWGVIYTLMAGFVVWQCHPSRAGWVGQLVGLWFIANCLANALWIVAFTQEWGNLWVSTVVIVGLLATISVLYTSFRLTEKMTFIQYLVTNVYISVYLGWVSGA